MNEKYKAHLALLGANLFYGAGFSVAKTIMPVLIKPNAFILIRISIATLLFWLSYMGGANFRTSIDKKDWKLLIWCAFTGVACNQMLFFLGLNLTSPIQASLMMLSTPILVSLLAAWYLNERFRWYNIIGLAIGVSGALILVLNGKSNAIASNPALGNLLVLLNATSYAIYLISVKPLMQKYRPIIVIRWVFLFGFLFVFPFSIADFTRIDWSLFTYKHWSAVGFIVIGVTFFTYLWNIYALRVLSSSTAGAYIYLQPIFAALIAILFMGEHLEWYKALAGMLIFSGVYMASAKK